MFLTSLTKILAVIFLLPKSGFCNQLSIHRPTLRVIVNIFPPFSILKNSTQIKAKYQLVPKNQITGMEVEVFDILMKLENVKVEYYAKFSQDLYYGNISGKGKITGMLADLKSGKFDAAIGNIKEIAGLKRYFDMTYGWKYDNLLFCLQKDYINYQWKMVFNIFSFELHLVSIAWILAQTLIFWQLSRKSVCLKNSFFLAIKLLLGSPVKFPCKKLPRTAALGLLIFQGFLAIIYQSKWINMLADPKSGYILIPDNINYLFEHRYKVHYNPYDKALFLELENYRSVLNNSKMCFSYKQCIQGISQDKRSFTLLSNSLVNYLIGNNLFGRPDCQLRCISNAYIRHSLHFVFARKEHYLTKKINRRLLSLYGHGFVSRNAKKIFKYQPNPEMTIIGKDLGLKHIRPVFYFLIFGYFLAMSCFILELLIYWIKNL